MRYIFLIFSLGVLFTLAAIQTSKDNITRQLIPFDQSWRFILGEQLGAENPNFDDSNWRLLDVPHDWSIEGEYDSLNPAGIAGAFLPTGIGWYRKSFRFDQSWSGKKVRISFDGVYLNSTVWINGHKLGTRPNGYIGFEYDITEHLNNGENTISVRVDHEKSPTGRWYTGSGIYRHVKLIVTNSTFIPRNEIFVTTPIINKESAKIIVDLRINATSRSKKLEIIGEVLGPNGLKLKTVKNAVKGDNSAVLTFEVEDPNLWSTINPTLYTAKLQLRSKKETLDEVEVSFGIRDIEVSTNGLFINGVRTQLKGICMHHDAGPVGTAVPEDVLYYRLLKLKNMGCNAIRTSHNPFAPEFYAMCDTLGFLVMDEAFDGWEKEKAQFDYGLYFEDWWEQDLSSFIKRDRNHPSVIMWSIGNEVSGYTDQTQKMLVDFVKSLDSTRQITQGRGYVGKWIDIAGFNGHGELKNGLDHFREEHPEKPIIGTEMTHSYQTRGIYRTKTWYRLRDFPAPWEIKYNRKFEEIEDRIFLVDDLTEEEVFTGIDPRYQSSYDNSVVRMNVKDYWKSTRDNKWFLGAFRWTGFDYLGESFGWPARTMSFGVIDLAGFETDTYYLYQSLWSDEPMVHLLPHWTHPGKEGVEIPVVVYTNCKEAELFLNDKSLGKKAMRDELQLVWNVPFEKGELKVVATSTDGNKISKVYKTADFAYGVKLETNRVKASANSQDVIIANISIVDKNGVEVPYANNNIEFKVSGPGKIIGVENGDILDLSPHKVNNRKAFNGKCLLLVQTTNETGQIRITASSKGLKSESIEVDVN